MCFFNTRVETLIIFAMLEEKRELTILVDNIHSFESEWHPSVSEVELK